MREPVTIGSVDLSPTLQARVTICNASGKRVIDVRLFDLFAGVFMPGKRGVSIPVEHAEELCRLTTEAAARAKAER